MLYRYLFLALASFFLFSSSASAQILSYEDEQIPVDFVDMADAAPTEILALAGEDEIYPVPLPFGFEYFGVAYTEAFVSINGNVSFGQPYNTLDYNREKLCFPQTNSGATPTNPDNFIMVNWDDLFLDPTCMPSTGATPMLSTRTIGSEPNRVFIVTWDYFLLSAPIPPCAGGELGSLRAQLKLFEGSNNIEIHIPFNRMADTFDGTFSGPSIGVENIDGTYANYVRCGRDQVELENKAWRFTPSPDFDPGFTNPDVYCPANGELCNDYGTIGEFTFNEVTTANRGCEGGLSPEDRAYADNTDVILTHELGTPSAFSGTINNDLDILGVPFPSSVALWIDWNQDSIFSEDELSNGVAAQGTFTGNVVEPLIGALPGFTRLRVRTYNTGNCNETPEPCGQTCGNEVEDYTIQIIDPANPIPECPTVVAPTNGQRNLCQTTTITWNQPSNVEADSFQVFIQAEGQGKRDFFQVDTSFTNGFPYPTDAEVAVVISAFSNGQRSSGCDTLTFTIAPDPDPVVDIQPRGEEIFSCINSNLPLFGVTGYPSNITHTWSGPATAFLTATDIEDPVFNSPVESSFKLFYEAENDFGCGGIDSTIVTTLDGARLEDYDILNTEACFGDTVTALVKGAVGEVIFEDSTSGNAFTEITPFSLSDSTFGFDDLAVGNHFIRLRVELGDCDVFRDTIRVTINDLPVQPQVAFVNGIGEVCQGEDITMEITNFQTGMFWNDAGNSATQTLGTDGSGVFFASFTQNGCTSKSEELDAVVNPTPMPEISRNVPTACSGDTLRLFIQNEFESIRWDVNTADSTSNIISVTEDGTYTVSVEDENGCLGGNSEEVSFFAKPEAPVVTQLDPDPACNGGTVRIVASYEVAGAWNTGSTADTLFIEQPGTFTYVSTSQEGCSTPAEDTLDITFFDEPAVVAVRAEPGAPYCEGDFVLLIADVPNNPVWNTGAMNDSIIVSQTGTYSVAGEDANGCTVQSRPLTLTFSEFPETPSIIQSNDSLTSSVTASFYEWTLDDAPLNKNQKSIKILENGTYRLRVYNGSGCESEQSNSVTITNVSILERLQSEGISVYPIPTSNGMVNLKVQQDVEVEIYSTSGKLVMSKQVNSGTTKIALPNQGMYMMQISTPSMRYTVRLLHN